MVVIRVTKRDGGLYDLKRVELGPHAGGYPRIETAKLNVPRELVEQMLDNLRDEPSSERMAQAYNDIRITGWPDA